MKKFLFMAVLASALISCSRDQIIDLNRDNDEIRFGVVANSATKAEKLYCNQFLPSEFYVWATHDNKTYIDGDQITYDNVAGKWENQSGVRYWPESGDVKFFAHVNAGQNFKWNDGVPTIEDFTVADEVAIQKDLLYAVTSKAKSNDPVKVNFRHALSQIVFMAKNTNKNLHVEINGVGVGKVSYRGTFTYPTGVTDENFENHTGNQNDQELKNVGSWSILPTKDRIYQYEQSFGTVKNDGTGNFVTNKGEANDYHTGAFLLMPQTTTAWDPSTDNDPELQEGSYLYVKCKICNIAGETYSPSTDVVLYNNKWIAIPAAFDWKPGKKYIYTIIFGDGNGGYNPEPPGPDPEPVLVPITFDVSVDDFVIASVEDIDMKTI